MKNTLNKYSKMECENHGSNPPAFICRHLQHGIGIGFHEPEEEFDSEWPFRNGWCSECEAFAIKQGGWNDASEAFAQVLPVCDGCYEEIKQRNT